MGLWSKLYPTPVRRSDRTATADTNLQYHIWGEQHLSGVAGSQSAIDNTALGALNRDMREGRVPPTVTRVTYVMSSNLGEDQGRKPSRCFYCQIRTKDPGHGALSAPRRPGSLAGERDRVFCPKVRYDEGGNSQHTRPAIMIMDIMMSKLADQTSNYNLAHKRSLVSDQTSSLQTKTSKWDSEEEDYKE